MDITYSIADIAEKTGLSLDTIRYYEKIGILPPVKREENGRRAYSTSDLQRYMFITHLKRAQMPLKDIERYISLSNEQNYEGCYQVLEEHRLRVEGLIAEMTDSLSTIKYKLENFQSLIDLKQQE